ncbi:hypothetical protein COV06_03915 [Candidatus Uhrbacteria bacterium CG10_big_fil_rev_8_21_14_0_10_50_16]|uniref:Uncharacterized protein n=1 Tax=Candidatus Uhrbacteria bacterium CG10_big_fil_rev_8_21_14_0_10_50_16 TaxID=1975039 RepID=A0A2H0RLA9_9BACT|nr:MAG: hypothetical protein COV06_03915 [Candidatus Uhrbacteria bacterium CG10_big_fil_rev_8_21_14_0_10_50_16]
MGLDPAFVPENTCVLKYEFTSILKTHVFEDKPPRRSTSGNAGARSCAKNKGQVGAMLTRPYL